MSQTRIFTISVIIVGALWVLSNLQVNTNNLNAVNTDGFAKGVVATIYKDPNCGCCEGYIKEMQKNGFKVNVIETDDMPRIKSRFNIVPDKQSCHTITLDNGYLIEGHVPMKAVKQLLTEKPHIDGIGLAGMPAGAPGMPGVKVEMFNIYQMKDGKYSDYMSI